MSNFIVIICCGVGEYHQSGKKPDGLEFPLTELSATASGLYQYHLAKKKTLKSKKCYSKECLLPKTNSVFCSLSFPSHTDQ